MVVPGDIQAINLINVDIRVVTFLDQIVIWLECSGVVSRLLWFAPSTLATWDMTARAASMSYQTVQCGDCHSVCCKEAKEEPTEDLFLFLGIIDFQSLFLQSGSM